MSCYLEGCNPYKPIDCTKRWLPCKGEGPNSRRAEKKITPAKYGGKCVLRIQRGKFSKILSAYD